MTKPRASLENKGEECSFIAGRGQLGGAVITEFIGGNWQSACSGFSLAGL